MRGFWFVVFLSFFSFFSFFFFFENVRSGADEGADSSCVWFWCRRIVGMGNGMRRFGGPGRRFGGRRGSEEGLGDGWGGLRLGVGRAIRTGLYTEVVVGLELLNYWVGESCDIHPILLSIPLDYTFILLALFPFVLVLVVCD